MPQFDSIPSTWAAKFGFSAEFNLRLKKEVTRLGIDPKDMDKVTEVADRLRQEDPEAHPS